MAEQKHVFVGLSGGVDSSVAAMLLLQEGYKVTGVFMKNWSDCDWLTEERWAKKAAAHLNIPFFSWDFEESYREKVLSNFYAEYKKGRTPNPDVLCNKFIKFDLFLKKALEHGADAIATGHYARVESGSLHKGRDRNKDQSYFLYALDKKQLSRVLFPLGDLTKTQVRELAKNAKLPNHDKKDSQGICFVGNIDLKSFLQEKITPRPGMIINAEGAIIGAHEGVQFYTEGQREGLQLGGLSKPHYVAYKDTKTNTIIATERDHPLLYAQKVFMHDVHQLEPIMNATVMAKARYRQPDQKAYISKENGGYVVEFAAPQFALSEGQSIVLYDGDRVLGGGIIDSVIHPEGLVETIKKGLNEQHAISRN